MPAEVLEYEESTPPRRWRRFLVRWTGRLLVPALVIGLLAAGWWRREGILDWAGWQLAMRQAWGHEMPREGSSILVNGEKAVALAAANADYVLDDQGFATYHPASLRRLADYDWRCQDLDFWARPYPNTEQPPIAFMSVMRRPDGQERLVVITGGAANALSLLRDVRVLVLAPPSLWGSERMGALNQMMWNGSGQVKPGVLHMANIDAGNPGRLLVPYTTYGHESRQPVGKGTVALVLGDDDVLRASIVDVVLAAQPDELGLGRQELLMLPRLGPPHEKSPWRTQFAAMFQTLEQMPTTRPIDW